MPAPAELPADFDFSKQGPPNELPANFDFGGGQPKQTAEHPGYWQELYQQSGIPGLIKGIKEHPAETVASAIGGLFAPLNPNFTQSPQGQAMKENLTRSPQSLGAALTLGGLAALPAAGEIIPPVGEAINMANRAVGGAAKGLAKTPMTGMWGPVVAGEMLGIPRPVTAGLVIGPRMVKGAVKGAQEALGEDAAIQAKYGAPAAKAATEAAAPPPVRASRAPLATAPPASPATEAPPTAPGKTAADLFNEEMGAKETAPTATPPIAKTPGQLLAESEGEKWDKLSGAQQQMYEQFARPPRDIEAENAPQPKPARGSAHYGVKPAQTPPVETTPQPIVSRETAPQPVAASPAAAPTAKVQPIRPAPTAEAQDIDFQMRHGEQEQPEVAKFLGHEQPTPAPEATPARPTPAAAAKSARYADAIGRWARDRGMSVRGIADQWEAASPEVKGQIYLELQRKGYLGANETIPKTSAQGIVDALKARAQTIKPPAGFSMGEMGTGPSTEAPATQRSMIAESPKSYLPQVLKGDVRQATAGEINKALDKIDQMDHQATEEFISAGRGNERPSDYANKTDPLSMRQNDLYRQRTLLRNEIERRYGPGAPSRLPKGFGPIR